MRILALLNRKKDILWDFENLQGCWRTRLLPVQILRDSNGRIYRESFSWDSLKFLNFYMLCPFLIKLFLQIGLVKSYSCDQLLQTVETQKIKTEAFVFCLKYLTTTTTKFIFIPHWNTEEINVNTTYAKYCQLENN